MSSAALEEGTGRCGREPHSRGQYHRVDGMMRSMRERSHSVSRIAADVRALGLDRGALVMVHASLRKVGPVAGRADGLIDAIRVAIGEEGTMLMVLGAQDEHAWVNDRAEAGRAELLAEAVPFEAMTTPAAPDVGMLAEVFRQRPETVVSDHPEGRFAAAGPLAHTLLDDVPWDDYFGPGSPLEQLVDRGGVILRLGADLNTLTALHHAEYLCAVSPKRRVRRHRLVATADGARAIRVVECLDDEEGIVDYPGEDYFEDLLRDYLATGRARSGLVGQAHAELLEAADVVAYGVRWMEERLAPLAWSVDPRALTPRLDADLLDARQRRSGPEVDALRTLKSALANAEAVPVADGPYRVVEGSAEAPRRILAGADIDAVLGNEIEERRRAVVEYQRLGQPVDALQLGLRTLERYARVR